MTKGRHSKTTPKPPTLTKTNKDGLTPKPTPLLQNLFWSCAPKLQNPGPSSGDGWLARTWASAPAAFSSSSTNSSRREKCTNRRWTITGNRCPPAPEFPRVQTDERYRRLNPFTPSPPTDGGEGWGEVAPFPFSRQTTKNKKARP